MFDIASASVAAFLFIGSLFAAPAQPTDENQGRISMNTLFEAEQYPEINTRVISGGIYLVGGPEYYDEFPSTTSVTQVVVTINPPSGESIDVVTVSGPTWYETAGGTWQATFSMPAAGYQTQGEISVELSGSSGDPTGGVIIIGRDGP